MNKQYGLLICLILFIAITSCAPEVEDEPKAETLGANASASGRSLSAAKSKWYQIILERSGTLTISWTAKGSIRLEVGIYDNKIAKITSKIGLSGTLTATLPAANYYVVLNVPPPLGVDSYSVTSQFE